MTYLILAVGDGALMHLANARTKEEAAEKVTYYWYNSEGVVPEGVVPELVFAVETVNAITGL